MKLGWILNKIYRAALFMLGIFKSFLLSFRKHANSENKCVLLKRFKNEMHSEGTHLNCLQSSLS